MEGRFALGGVKYVYIFEQLFKPKRAIVFQNLLKAF